MEKIEIKNPYDLSSIKEIELETKDQVLRRVERADSAYRDRSRWLPKDARIEVLDKTRSILQKNRDALITQAVKEGGKPFQDSSAEIDRGLEGIQVAIDELCHWGGSEIPMGRNKKSRQHIAYTTMQPRGPVLSISAFNHPFNLAIHQIIPAVAVGCPVIIKPSTTTPLSAKSIVEALIEAGLNEDFCQYVTCGNDAAEAMVADKRTQFLSFIGSSKVGWHLRSKLSNGAACALEHGGAAPVIVDESADLASCIPALVKAGYYHAGQACVSAQRIYLHQNIKDEFSEKFTEAVKNLQTGDPLSKDTDVGPLISPKEVQRVGTWVDEAKDEGAELLLGGEAVSETLYHPTILSSPSPKSKVSREEIFGPVTCLYEFDKIEEAVEAANSLDFAFQSSIFSNRIDHALQAANRLAGLTVLINEHPAFRVDWMPFGGYKESGLAVGGIGYSMKDMSIEKMIVIKSAEQFH